MLVGSDDGVRIWLDGKQVHEFTRDRKATPDQDRVRVELNKGWNKILVKVVNRQGDHGLYLRFNTSDLRGSRTPTDQWFSPGMGLWTGGVEQRAGTPWGLALHAYRLVKKAR
jgi:hypothetical protein